MQLSLVASRCNNAVDAQPKDGIPMYFNLCLRCVVVWVQMLAPAVTSTGAAQVAEPMIVAEPEKKSAEKRSHDNLDDPEVDAAAKRGAAAQLQHTALIDTRTRTRNHSCPTRRWGGAACRANHHRQYPFYSAQLARRTAGHRYVLIRLSSTAPAGFAAARSRRPLGAGRFWGGYTGR